MPTFRQAVFTLAGAQVEVLDSYAYLGVQFTITSGQFSMTQIAKDRVTQSYPNVAMLEQYHQALPGASYKSMVI